MSKKALFRALGIVVAVYMVSSFFSKGEKNFPNVVLLIIDTLRADKLGCYGFEENTSPEIDALAGKGVQFNNVLAQSSWTRSSHGSFLTALYPRSVGIYKERYDILPDKYTTFAELLKNAGYKTIGITANPHINSTFNFDQGFDKYADSVVVVKWMKKEYKLREEKTAGRDTPFSSVEYIFKRAIDMVGEVAGPPVYLQINIMDVHEAMKSVVQQGLRPEFQKLFNDPGVNKRYSDYHRTIRQVSFYVGKFIEELTARPGWDNTLFIITSDHGEGLYDHDGVMLSRGHAYLLYSSHLWVPLILYHHGGKQEARKIDRPVRLMDMMPTVLDYLDIPVPANLHGVSLLKSDSLSDVVLPEYFVAEATFRKANKLAVYSKDWTYIENRDKLPIKEIAVNKTELHPSGVKEKGVLTDMAGQRPEIVKKMKEFLAGWEERYPKQKSTSANKSPSAEEIKQLKSLGYLK